MLCSRVAKDQSIACRYLSPRRDLPAHLWHVLAFHRMTRHTQLVSIRVAEVCPIVMSMVLRPQAGQTLRHASVREGGLVGEIDECSIGSEESNHLTVARIMLSLVVRSADEEQWANAIGALPTRPRVAAVAEARFNAETFQHRAVECKSAVKVSDAYEDVRKHGDLSSIGNGQNTNHAHFIMQLC